MVATGEYTATLVKMIDGQTTDLAAPQKFTVKRMKKGSLEGATPDATAAFWRQLEDVNLELSGTNVVVKENLEKLKMMSIAINLSQSAPGDLDKRLHVVSTKLQKMDKQLSGDPQRNEVGEKSTATIGDRLSVAALGTSLSTYGPTPTHKQNLQIAQNQLEKLRAELSKMVNEQIPSLEQELLDAKAPYVKGATMK